MGLLRMIAGGMRRRAEPVPVRQVRADRLEAQQALVVDGLPVGSGWAPGEVLRRQLGGADPRSDHPSLTPLTTWRAERLAAAVGAQLTNTMRQFFRLMGAT